MRTNASGLTWIGTGGGGQRLLFSENKEPLHMALVTATESGKESRDVYVPPTQAGMAHFSYLAPDGRSVLVIEMDGTGWLPCRLVPFDGSSAGRPVGPPAAPCLAAAWSPDGKWMYFSSGAGGSFHIWRQQFPDGTPEQVTSGPTEEEGIAMAPDGRSFVTSIGTTQNTIWLHDASGDRQVTSEGFGYRQSFSQGGSKLYYLVRSGSSLAFWIGELWELDLPSGRRERILPNFLVSHYSFSADGKRLVFSDLDASGKSRIWMASADRRLPPRKLTADGGPNEQRPFFSSSGEVSFLVDEGKDRFIYRMKEDGTGRRKLLRDPARFLVSASPDGNWLAVWNADGDVVIYPAEDGAPVRVGHLGGGPVRQGTPIVNWAPDGKFFLIERAAPMGGP